jgi:nucleoside-diphosphate-sugar epimerase
MRVFVAGATGVVGVRLVPELVRRGLGTWRDGFRSGLE